MTRRRSENFSLTIIQLLHGLGTELDVSHGLCHLFLTTFQGGYDYNPRFTVGKTELYRLGYVVPGHKAG